MTHWQAQLTRMMTNSHCCHLLHQPYLPWGKQGPVQMTVLAYNQNWTEARYVYWYRNKIPILQYVYLFLLQGDMNESDLSQEEELAVLKEQHALLTRLLLQQKEVSYIVSWITLNTISFILLYIYIYI